MLPGMLFIRLIFCLVIAILIVRLVYVFGPRHHKLGIRLILREIGRIIVVTLAIYWIYMISLYFMNK